MASHCSILAWRTTVHRVAKNQTQLTGWLCTFIPRGWCKGSVPRCHHFLFGTHQNIYGHCGRRKQELYRVSLGWAIAPARKWHTHIFTAYCPELVISHHRGARMGNPPEGRIAEKEEELEYLETGTNDYHIYGNVRIQSLIYGRTLKPENILCLTCVIALSVAWNYIEKFGNFKIVFKSLQPESPKRERSI